MPQLLPQDVLPAVRLLDPPKEWTFASLGTILGISASQCHLAFKRLGQAELVGLDLRLPIRGNLLEFLSHGIRYAFPAELGAMVQGVPTAHSAPIWKSRLVAPSEEKLVWEHPKGKTRGLRVELLYKTAPGVALQHEKTYSILAIVDSLRLGKARERQEAQTLLKEIIYDERP